MEHFTIDFFQLMFLAESIIPPAPIARSMYFDDLSEKYYHQLSPSQREQLFNHVLNQVNFTLENQQCQHFFARYNPKNQYLVQCFYNGEAGDVACYRFNDTYHTAIQREINPNYITKITRIYDNQTMPLT